MDGSRSARTTSRPCPCASTSPTCCARRAGIRQALADRHRVWTPASGRCSARTIRHTLLTAGSLGGDLRGLGRFQRGARPGPGDVRPPQGTARRGRPSTLSSANNLAIDLRLVGDCFRARDLDQDTLNRRQLVLGADHPYTLHSASMLARDMREAGDYAGLRRTAPGDLRALPRTSSASDFVDTLRTAKSLAVSLRKIGRARRGLRADQGHSTSGTCRRYGRPPRLARLQAEPRLRPVRPRRQGGRLRIASEVLQVYQRRSGDATRSRWPWPSNMAAYLRGIGSAGEALALAESTLRVVRDNLGDDHPLPSPARSTRRTACMTCGGSAKRKSCSERPTTACARRSATPIPTR